MIEEKQKSEDKRFVEYGSISRFRLYCTDEQTKRAYRLGAPLQYIIGERQGESSYAVPFSKKNKFGNEVVFYLVPPTVDELCAWMADRKGIILKRCYEAPIEKVLELVNMSLDALEKDGNNK